MPTSEGLVRGGYYHVFSRNLVAGVFDGNRGIIGIREKFDRLYLFTEYLCDGGDFGTVFRVSPLLAMLSEDIPVQEAFGTIDWKSKRPMRFIEAPKDAPVDVGGHWEFSDTGEAASVVGEKGARPCSPHNDALFNWLMEREPSYEEARRSCGMDW